MFSYYFIYNWLREIKGDLPKFTNLLDLWIFSEDGLVVFKELSNLSEEVILPDLFGGMVSALNTYAENISEGGISSFTFENNRFLVMKKQRFMFVARSHVDREVRKIKKELEGIMRKFFSRFSKDLLRNWKGGNTSIFSSFRRDLLG